MRLNNKRPEDTEPQDKVDLSQITEVLYESTLEYSYSSNPGEFPYLSNPEGQSYTDPDFVRCEQLDEYFHVILGSEYWQLQLAKAYEIADSKKNANLDKNIFL